MKKTFSFLILMALVLGLFSGCNGQQIQLDYHESFAISAFNDINGKLGYSKGYVLQGARYAYIDADQLALPEGSFDDCDERQQYYFTQLYCCVELTVLQQGEVTKYIRYFSISSYDFTSELEGKQCLSLLYEKLTFERMDITRLSHFIAS